MLQKLLIIDDATAVHDLVRARLKDELYEIRSAYNTEAGETVIRAFRPDLILLDIDMPGEDGFAFCRRLKQDPVTSRIAIIFLTATGQVETKVKGLELGAVDFVTKPFDPAELRARVRASLRTKALIDELAHTRVSVFMREATASLGA